MSGPAQEGLTAYVAALDGDEAACSRALVALLGQDEQPETPPKRVRVRGRNQGARVSDVPSEPSTP